MADDRDEPSTQALLRRLGEGSDATAWGAFDRRFRPVVEAVIARLGLQAEDAADLAQEVLVEFLRVWRRGSFEERGGGLRGWFQRVARARVVDLRRRRAYLAGAAGDSLLASLSDPEGFSKVWERECRERMFEEALRRLRSGDTDPRTLRAFEEVAFRERPAAEVADELGISVQSVYNAKHRCAKRLAELLRELEGHYGEGGLGR